MPDNNELMEKLDKLIMPNSDHTLTSWSTDRNYGILGLSISVRIEMLQALENTLHSNLPPRRFEGMEPLIDIIETSDIVRVIVTMSRIKKEDVWYEIKKDSLEMAINKNGRVYKKEVPFAFTPEKTLVKSMAPNNSVLEIIFTKK